MTALLTVNTVTKAADRLFFVMNVNISFAAARKPTVIIAAFQAVREKNKAYYLRQKSTASLEKIRFAVLLLYWGKIILFQVRCSQYRSGGS